MNSVEQITLLGRHPGSQGMNVPEPREKQQASAVPAAPGANDSKPSAGYTGSSRRDRRYPVAGVLAGLVFSFFAIFPVSLAAEAEPAVKQWSVGQTFDAIRYEDQHGRIQILDTDVRNVVFLADMDAKDILHEELQPLGDTFLKESRSVIIADIHKMPAIISRVFALPAMRDYSYTLHLIRTEGPGLRFPLKPGQMTLLRLENRKILSIEIFVSGEELIKELGQQP
jgi:hypothetical protein